jgi:Flp pilus assembly pilin Flp
MLVALITLVAVVAVTNSGPAINSSFSSVASQLQNAAQAAGA